MTLEITESPVQGTFYKVVVDHGLNSSSVWVESISALTTTEVFRCTGLNPQAAELIWEIMVLAYGSMYKAIPQAEPLIQSGAGEGREAINGGSGQAAGADEAKAQDSA